MAHINGIFDRLRFIIQKEGQSEFISAIVNHLLNNDADSSKSIKENETDSYILLKAFVLKICKIIDNLSSEIQKDDSILISVKDQKVLRTCFQLITSIGICPCLITGLGISLSKRCNTSSVISQINFNDDEKYDLLVHSTNFFTRSYKIPVLKNIIITMHLSDYLAALIQLAFAPLKKPGTYQNFVMTQDKYNKLNIEREQFKLTYEHLVANCFQPTLMKELLVLQSVDPAPPAFVKKVIAQELSRRLLAPGGLLSLIRCFIETYDRDVGLEWKKVDMICKIVSVKHGTISETDYLTNITSQLTKILSLNNTHYLATAIACVLSLKEKYPDSEPVKRILEDIFQAFNYENIISKSSVPGTVLLTPNEVDNKVNILHVCVSSIKTDCHVSLLAPNLHILFIIGMKCVKNSNLKIKLKDILTRCLEKLNKKEVTDVISKWLFGKNNSNSKLDIVEYDAGVAIKCTLTESTEYNTTEALSYFLDLFKSASGNDLVKSVFEASLDILVYTSTERNNRGNRDLLTLEEEPVILDELDEQYATILQILSEISTSPKVLKTLKTHPTIVTNFIEHILSKTPTNSHEECVTIALVLLNTVLANADNKEFENSLRTVIPILRKMSQDKSSYKHILCKEALNLLSSESSQKSESACEKAISDVFDNLLPVRAHGIIELTRLVDKKDAEAISKKHYIFCIFQDQLNDPDTYIYLSAINGLAALGTHCTEDVLQVLCREFLQISTDKGSVQTSSKENKISELRMKIGDVIVKITKRLGEMAVVHKTILLNTMLCGCRDDDPLVRTSALSNLAEIALVLHYKMGTIIYEVLLCIWSIIETDKAVECRRAAVMVITSLLKGLGKETLIQLKENLLPIYRTLKTLYRDNNEDSIVRLHAQLALEELNDIVNQFLFPEVKMESQIFVLDKPDVYK